MHQLWVFGLQRVSSSLAVIHPQTVPNAEPSFAQEVYTVSRLMQRVFFHVRTILHCNYICNYTRVGEIRECIYRLSLSPQRSGVRAGLLPPHLV